MSDGSVKLPCRCSVERSAKGEWIIFENAFLCPEKHRFDDVISDEEVAQAIIGMPCGTCPQCLNGVPSECRGR